MTARLIRVLRGFAVLMAFAGSLHPQTGTPLQIVTASLPPATVGAAYNQQILTSGGTCGVSGFASSSIDAGSLPTGLSVTSAASAQVWAIQGVPSVAGDFAFTLHLTWTRVRTSPFQPDCSESATKQFTITVQSGGGGGTTTPPPTSSTLTPDKTQITATYRIPHFPPAADTVHVNATGSTNVDVAAQAVTDIGGPWLSVTPSRSTTPATLSVGYLVSGVATGTYTGRVVVTTTAGATLTIPVTLQVTIDTSVQLQVSPLSLAFTSSLGVPDPAGQALKVTVTGENVIFQAAVAAPPNGKWLTVTPSGSATPASLTVGVAGKDLAVGVYHGTITLSVAGVTNATVAIPVTFTMQSQSLRPAISVGGVINAAGSGNAIAPGTWVSIFGAALSANSRAWKDADFKNGALPTALDDVSVTIDGKPAAVAFISAQQINVLAADDTTTGLVPVQVKNSLGTSDSALALQQTAAPAFFQIPGTKYAAATHADGSYVAALTLAAVPGTPAKVGETIVLYGTGFGATQPAISATALVPASLPLARPADLSVRIGGLDASIAFAGLISPGLYQFNVVVPDLAAGDQPVVAELRGLLTQSGILLTVQR